MATSTSDAVGAAAEAMVSALNLVPAAQVVRRKVPGAPEGTVPKPPEGTPAGQLRILTISISVGEEGDTEYLTAVLKVKNYPVAVTIVTNTGRDAADDDQIRQWRQQIEVAIESRSSWRAQARVIGFGYNLATITNKPPFDPAALSKDFNYSTVVATVSVVEPRAT